MFCKTENTYRKISEHRHYPRAGTGANLRAVFIKGDVPDPVGTILDYPVSTVQFKQSFGTDSVLIKTGYNVRQFTACPAIPLDNSLYQRNLFMKWEINITLKFTAAPDTAYFDSSVSVINGFIYRGE
jgi:hypothetical protein